MAFLVLATAVTWAQSGIAGIARDTSGAVLPGVTVEATSPALIEKVRTAVTDSEGRYIIVDLRPGNYVVTFTLPGFSTFKRDGIVLPSGFTASVNAELRVGGLEETITVTGEAPVVDVQNVARQETLSKQLLEAVPSGRMPHSYTALMPGAVQGAQNQVAVASSYLATVISFHGRGESQYATDGFNISHQMNDRSQHAVNQATVQELVVSTGSAGAEQQAGGIVTNVIPKEGGNTFSGQMYAHFTNESFLGDNLTDELRALGATTQSTRDQSDYNPAVGGPIKKDRLWFFGSYRQVVAEVDAKPLER